MVFHFVLVISCDLKKTSNKQKQKNKNTTEKISFYLHTTRKKNKRANDTF